VIGAGFDAVLRHSGAPSYQHFLVPGILGMTMLFGAMLAALSMVYDKESGVMRMLVVAPFEHYWIVVARLLAAVLAAVIQAVLVMVLLAILGFLRGGFAAGPLLAGVFGTAFVCAALGMLVAAWTRTLDNFAVMMNFVIFPVFFLSGSLYPIEHLPRALRVVAMFNPYTYGVDLLKHGISAGGGLFGPDFALTVDCGAVIGFTIAATLIACLRFSRDTAYEPLIRFLAKNRND
jgi:ABC-2 type transport system permease protein